MAKHKNIELTADYNYKRQRKYFMHKVSLKMQILF